MLTIRQEQVNVFSEMDLQKFTDWLLAHIRNFFPRQAARIGSELCTLTEYGIARASTYGIRSKVDICKYVDLMMTFDRDFDTRTRWAAEILSKKWSPQAKMQLLLSAAKRELPKAGGSDVT